MAVGSPRFMSGNRDINLNGAGRLFDTLGVKVDVPAGEEGRREGQDKGRAGRNEKK